MSINKELLEKYHLGTCSNDEKKQVEEWLFSAEVDDLDETTLNHDKHIYKKEMWDEIKTIIPEKLAPVKSNNYFMWKGAIAASLFLFLVAGISYFFLRDAANTPSSVSLNNSSDVNVKHVNSDEYNVSVGPNTIAKINNLSGVIDLSGSMLISPKEDIHFSFKGTQKKVILKKGQSYIILNASGDTKGIIVISERNLLDLPPVMQKQITTQFGI